MVGWGRVLWVIVVLILKKKPMRIPKSYNVLPDPVGALPEPVKERLSSLDFFRGFTVALMILVDRAGAAFPEIDHSPWDGIALADFVMPFFDFIVGISVVLAFKQFDIVNDYDSYSKNQQAWSIRRAALAKACMRTARLFVVGILTQGCINLFECNVMYIRVMGILQRVAVCYLFAAASEILLPRAPAAFSAPEPIRTPTFNNRKNNYSRTRFCWSNFISLLSRYRWHWFMLCLMVATHTSILYGIEVPPVD